MKQVEMTEAQMDQIEREMFPHQFEVGDGRVVLSVGQRGKSGAWNSPRPTEYVRRVMSDVERLARIVPMMARTLLDITITRSRDLGWDMDGLRQARHIGTKVIGLQETTNDYKAMMFESVLLFGKDNVGDITQPLRFRVSEEKKAS